MPTAPVPLLPLLAAGVAGVAIAGVAFRWLLRRLPVATVAWHSAAGVAMVGGTFAVCAGWGRAGPSGLALLASGGCAWLAGLGCLVAGHAVRSSGP